MRRPALGRLTGRGALGVRASASTFLRALHRAGSPPIDFGEVEAIGLDDFSWNRGQSWGTLIVDLKTSRPLVLLQGRRREDVEPWLREHLPHVRIVTRDRAGAYFSAVSAACPGATQIADRWHLLKNVVGSVTDAVRANCASLRRTWERHHTAEHEAAPESSRVADENAGEPTSRAARRSLERAKVREQKMEQLRELSATGMTYEQMEERVGMSRKTIKKWLRDGPPSQAKRPRRKALDKHAGALRAMWEQRVRRAPELHRAIAACGYRGGVSSVQRYVRPWRDAFRQERGEPPAKLPAMLGVRELTWQLLRGARIQQGCEEKDEALSVLCEEHPWFERAGELFEEFRHMLSSESSEGLDRWWAACAECATPMAKMARSMSQDEGAIRAACEMPWSNGTLEGHINRLKLFKRQMFGRASPKLLWLKMVHCP